jgi:hypothetical protein
MSTKLQPGAAAPARPELISRMDGYAPSAHSKEPCKNIEGSIALHTWTSVHTLSFMTRSCTGMEIAAAEASATSPA